MGGCVWTILGKVLFYPKTLHKDEKNEQCHYHDDYYSYAAHKFTLLCFTVDQVTSFHTYIHGRGGQPFLSVHAKNGQISNTKFFHMPTKSF